MANLQEIKNLTNNSLFHDKIRVAVFNIAMDVLNDPARAEEHPFFQEVVENPETWNVRPLAWHVARNPTIQEQLVGNPSATSENEKDNSIIYSVATEITKFSLPKLT